MRDDEHREHVRRAAVPCREHDELRPAVNGRESDACDDQSRKRRDESDVHEALTRIEVSTMGTEPAGDGADRPVPPPAPVRSIESCCFAHECDGSSSADRHSRHNQSDEHPPGAAVDLDVRHTGQLGEETGLTLTTGAKPPTSREQHERDEIRGGVEETGWSPIAHDMTLFDFRLTIRTTDCFSSHTD